MRHKDLVTEGIVGSEQNVRDMIQTIIMSLSAQGMDDIPTERIAHLLKKRMSIEVPYGTIMNILDTMPIVDSSSESQIDLKDDSSVNGNKEDAKDQVEQMALKGSSAEKKF